jgi:hypothetical protein
MNFAYMYKNGTRTSIEIVLRRGKRGEGEW